MEIEVLRIITGEQWIQEILQEYGSRQALEQQARQRGETKAKDDLFELRLLEESPRRRHGEISETSLMELEPRQVDRLTLKRLQLLEHLYASDKRENVSELAESLGRDKKNVSNDLRILREMGLVALARTGRTAFPRPRGNEIRIRLGGKVKRRKTRPKAA